jgi:hypothetical protein
MDDPGQARTPADDPGQDRPQVWLDWSLWCGRHLEPYRARWPQGAPLAMMRLFDAAVRMPAVIDAAGGRTENLTEALKRFAPLCCFISHDDLEKIYAETVPGRAEPDRNHDEV